MEEGVAAGSGSKSSGGEAVSSPVAAERQATEVIGTEKVEDMEGVTTEENGGRGGECRKIHGYG